MWNTWVSLNMLTSRPHRVQAGVVKAFLKCLRSLITIRSTPNIINVQEAIHLALTRTSFLFFSFIHVFAKSPYSSYSQWIHCTNFIILGKLYFCSFSKAMSLHNIFWELITFFCVLATTSCCFMKNSTFTYFYFFKITVHVPINLYLKCCPFQGKWNQKNIITFIQTWC